MMTQLRKTHVFLLVVLGLSIAGIGNLRAQEGQLVDVVVHSPSLEGNLLGDSPDRNVTVYLPPGYDDDVNRRYPVVYLLHGYTSNNTLWIGSGYVSGLNIGVIANRLIDQGGAEPMIMVMPDGENAYWGSWFTNSSVAGNWEDFIVHDLVVHIDNTYRTLPQAGSRGIAGHSMGGYGAMKLAMKHPELYSVVYAMSSVLSLEEQVLGVEGNDELILGAQQRDGFGEKNFGHYRKKVFTSLAVAVAPNAEAPLFADFPIREIDGEATLDEEIWERWLEHDPLSMLSTYGENLLKLRKVRFDCGSSDALLIAENRIFAQALVDANIPHVFDEYDGNHINRVRQRMETEVLPFFAETLSFELEPTAVEETTWGRIKVELQK